MEANIDVKHYARVTQRIVEWIDKKYNMYVPHGNAKVEYFLEKIIANFKDTVYFDTELPKGLLSRELIFSKDNFGGYNLLIQYKYVDIEPQENKSSTSSSSVKEEDVKTKTIFLVENFKKGLYEYLILNIVLNEIKFSIKKEELITGIVLSEICTSIIMKDPIKIK